MARSAILVSFFTAGVYAARIANKSTEHESQAVAHVLVPGQLLAVLQSPAMMRAPAVLPNLQVGGAPQIDFPQAFPRSRPVLMSVQDPGDPPDIPNDWKFAFTGFEGKARKAVKEAAGKAVKMAASKATGKAAEKSNNLGEAVDRLSPDVADDQMSGPSHPVARDENKNMEHIQKEYNLNLAKAIDSLNRDIPQALRADNSPRRLMPTNWDIYTDSYETHFKAANPMALRLLGAVIPSWKLDIKGLRSNQRVLQELRKVFRRLRRRFSGSDDVSVSTTMGVDPSTGQEVIEARWIAKFVMHHVRNDKNQIPRRRDINVQAVSRFYLNPEGKIYLQSIDELDVLVEGDFWS